MHFYPPHQEFECLTFCGNDYDRRLGKGYGEGLIIEYASCHSILFREADYIIKITGRDIVANIRALAGEIKDRSAIYANYTSYGGHLSCLSRVVGFPRAFLESRFIPATKRINDSCGFFFEDAIFETAKGSIREFRHPILAKGVDGTYGTVISPHLLQYVKAPIKYYLHRHGIFKIAF